MKPNQVEMMIPEYALNAEDVRGMMLDVMEAHLGLKTEGYRSTTNESFNLLLKRWRKAVVRRRCAPTVAGQWPATRCANR
jgi:hypothetical protein